MRKAERLGCAVESVNPNDIYERDEWMCGICGMAVDRYLCWPHRMSASLDHVIPLIAGGGHVKSNLQCSHLSCNVRKGSRVLIVAMPSFECQP